MDEIVVVEHDPCWPVIFGALAEHVRTAFGAERIVAIEHVGSTSVPGLAAKPIVDLDVVPRPEDVSFAIARLNALGYTHQGDLGIPGREAFERPPGTPPHHLYVCAAGSAELARHLLFRDYLRAHPEAVQQYAALKRTLARRFGRDRDAYTEAKTEFIVSVLAVAQRDKDYA